ncbi:MAG: hypothetical protein K6T65_14565, partial [Peptococcaceae bacterium]|nr:hypothetical protein [Peptococcaceae bacterium]
LIILRKNKSAFPKATLLYLQLALITTILAELSFTKYVSVYGVFNFIGHIFKIISFFFIYKALVKTALTDPFNLLWKKLKENEERLKEAYLKLNTYIEVLDLVFVVDSSVSMVDELRAVCDNIDVVKAALQANGIDFEYKVYLLGAGSVYHITTNPNPQYRIENMCGVDLPEVIGLNDQLMGIVYDGAYESEMWGAGVKWVAKYHPWREGAQRIVVPMSDECAWGGYNDGYGTAPNWPHTPPGVLKTKY